MKALSTIILLALIGTYACNTQSGDRANASKTRVLAVVEKGTSSFGFYTENGIRLKTVKLDTFPHEMVFSVDNKLAYATDNGSLRYRDSVEGGSTVSIIDLQKMEKVDEISLLPFKRPHGISVDTETGLMAVSVENPDKVLLIDPAKKNIVDTFECHGDTPHMIRLGPGAKQLFIANVLSHDVVITDMATREFVKIPVGRGPQGMDYQEKTNLLFVACSDYTSVIDVVKKREIHQIPLGSNRLELTKNDSLLLLSASGKGVGFVNANTFEVLYHLPIGYSPFSLNVSSDGKYAYVAAEPQNLVFVVSIDERKVVRKFRTPEGTRPDPVKDFWVEEEIDQKMLGRNTKEFPEFERIVLDPEFERGYQIKSADFNGDGLPDLAAVSDKIPEIYWYENPLWKRHLISNRTTKNIDLAPHDIDGDGDMDLALACRFNLNRSLEGGYLYWLQNTDKGHAWNLHYIDSFPTSHRLRWADIDGDQNKELVNLPIVGVGAKRPEFSVAAEFTFYELPNDPLVGPWEKHMIDTSLHMAHGLHIVRWDSDLKWDILTASFEGVYLFNPVIDHGAISWGKRQLAEGDTSPRPGQGSSEVGLGFLNGEKKPFITTIEPWHGDKVVFYTPSSGSDFWKRQVIDTTFQDGHALICADLDLDGNDEIIAGHRGQDYNLYLYQYDDLSNRWERHALDQGGMSAAGVCLLDVDNDGYMDIAACGSATENVVLYRNLGRKNI